MSISSIKRLSMRARNSISMFKSNDAEDKTSIQVPETPMRGKENDVLYAEEFGALTNDICHSSPTTHSRSPSQGSPSKRMRLLQPLRSVKSFRALRNSPSKEQGAIERPWVDVEDARTPGRKIRPSLTLDFEESPKDQPIFTLAPEKHCPSSSLLLHHSSPLPIPTTAKPDRTALPKFNFRSELPAGTIPTTPAPLQLALDMDPDRAQSPQPSPSPESKKDDMTTLPPPSPLPGTNLNFDDVFSASPMCSESSPGYVGISQGHKILSANLPLYLRSTQLEPSWTQLTDYELNSTQDNPPRLDTARKSSALQAGSKRDNLAAAYLPEQWTQDSQVVLDSIKHISSMVFPDPSHIPHCPKCHRRFAGSVTGKPPDQDLCDCPDQSQTSHETRASKSSYTFRDPRDIRTPLESTRNLYDGAGHGDIIASMISRPSSVSILATAPQGYQSSSTNICLNEPTPFVSGVEQKRDDEPSSTDHETLEDAYLAYAMQEEDLNGDRNNEISGLAMEVVADETGANVELTDRLAECTLGA